MTPWMIITYIYVSIFVFVFFTLTIWVAICGFIDLGHLFRSLKQEVVDDTDDGRVE